MRTRIIRIRRVMRRNRSVSDLSCRMLVPLGVPHDVGVLFWNKRCRSNSTTDFAAQNVRHSHLDKTVSWTWRDRMKDS